MNLLLPPLNVAARVARREMRSGLPGFGVFAACLFLGVLAISGVGSFSQAARLGLLRDAKGLLGGDLEVRLRHGVASPAQLDFLRQGGRISSVMETRAMLRPLSSASEPESVPLLVEVKAVDGNYPLYGEALISPPLPLLQTLEERAGIYGAIVDRLLLQRLGLSVGENVHLGDAVLQIRAVLESEPDRVVRLFSLGPRVMVNHDAFRRSGLAGVGNLFETQYRVALERNSAAAFAQTLAERFPDAGWRIRTFERATPRLSSLLERLNTQLTLLALCTLLVGGLGIAGGVRGYLSSKLTNIAVMKCVGASRRDVFFAYLLQVMSVGAVSSGAGIAVAAAIPYGFDFFWGTRFPVPLQPGLALGPLVSGGFFGLLVSAVFSYRALSAATSVSPSCLFRGDIDLLDGTSRNPQRGDYRAWFVGLALLAVGAFLVAGNIRLTTWFLLASALTFLCFYGLGGGLVAVAQRTTPPALRTLRLAMAQIRRPHSVARSAVLSMGIGLTALTSIALVEANLSRLVTRSLPGQAPSFFFQEILQDQVDRFDEILQAAPGVKDWERYPTLRGRITHISKTPVSEKKISPDVEWAVRGDRHLSFSATPPDQAQLVRGQWWPADYRGPALVSLTSDLAEGFGVAVGDTLTLRVLGREIVLQIANLREVDWTSLQLNFALILSPAAIEGAPLTYLGAARVAPEAESPLLKTLNAALPNVTAIPVRDVLTRVAEVVSQVGKVFRGMAAVALVTGLLVLAGTLSAEQHQRVADAVIYKVCGATRGDVLAVLAVEFLLIGGVSSLLSCITGTIAAWGIVKYLLQLSFRFDAGALLFTVALGVLLTVACGLLGTARVLGKSPAPYLRNP